MHFKPPEPTSCRGCHLSAGFHTQTAIVGTHVVTPGSQKADRKAESDPTVCFHSYQVQMQAELIWDDGGQPRGSRVRAAGAWGEREPPGGRTRCLCLDLGGSCMDVDIQPSSRT